jgi:hypothetical protein
MFFLVKFLSDYGAVLMFRVVKKEERERGKGGVREKEGGGVFSLSKKKGLFS